MGKLSVTEKDFTLEHTYNATQHRPMLGETRLGSHIHSSHTYITFLYILCLHLWCYSRKTTTWGMFISKISNKIKYIHTYIHTYIHRTVLDQCWQNDCKVVSLLSGHNYSACLNALITLRNTGLWSSTTTYVHTYIHTSSYIRNTYIIILVYDVLGGSSLEAAPLSSLSVLRSIEMQIDVTNKTYDVDYWYVCMNKPFCIICMYVCMY